MSFMCLKAISFEVFLKLLKKSLTKVWGNKAGGGDDQSINIAISVQNALNSKQSPKSYAFPHQ